MSKNIKVVTESQSSPFSGEVNVVMICCVSVSVVGSPRGTCVLLITARDKLNIFHYQVKDLLTFIRPTLSSKNVQK